MTDHKKHLYNLNELSDYKISDGYPDVRGWDVKDFDNRVIGKVDNLLVNLEAERVVYLDVEVDKSIIDTKHDPYGRPTHGDVREFVNKDGENHIIIPIGLVDLNEDSNYVYTDIVDHQTFAETKRYRKGDAINRNYEVQVLDSYGRRMHDRRQTDSPIENNEDIDNLPNEDRIREIVRQEIRKHHYETDTIYQNRNTTFDDRYEDQRRTYSDDGDPNIERPRYAEDVVDAEILTDEEIELEKRRRNDDLYDDDRFYERREFDDKRFRKRTPGL